jgi:putative nucleotidyltransferase with HDIG domain
MATIVDVRDPYTAGHQRRVAVLACAIGRELGLPKERIDGLEMAGDIHDIGKIRVPAEILSKPGKLTAPEMEIIRTHAEVGYEILKSIEFPWPVARIVRQHHERLDGSGYPDHLKGDQILLESRIICVADVVEAMSTHRPYRPGLGMDKALAEITEKRGTYYDPAVVDACLRVIRSGFRIE